MSDESLKITTLQIGALMNAIAVIVKHLDKNPDFHFEIRRNLHQFLEISQSQSYSDEAISLAKGTVVALLGESPNE